MEMQMQLDDLIDKIVEEWLIEDVENDIDLLIEDKWIKKDEEK